MLGAACLEGSGPLGAACPQPGEGADGSGMTVSRFVDGSTVCLWELGICWQLPSQPARLPWSQG